jgi:hypothetical protein
VAEVLNISVAPAAREHAVAPDVLEAVADRIELGTASIAVVGLGDRGLQLLLAAAGVGFPVIGIDDDDRRIRSLRDGRSYLLEAGSGSHGGLGTARFAGSPTTALAADVVILTGTDDRPERLIADVAEGLRPGQLVIVDSVVDAAGASRVRRAFEATGLVDGRDLGLALASSSGFDDGADVIGRGDESAALATRLYDRLGIGTSDAAWDAACSRTPAQPCTHGEQLIIDRLRHRGVTVSLVVPALNEAEGLALILPQIPSLVDEVIVVDGGSVDETLQVIRSTYPSAIRVRQRGRGKGNALKAGLAEATGDIVVTMDADGSMSPADIVPAVGALLDGCDFVKGSRALDGAGSGDFSPLHRMGNWALTTLSNLVFDAGYTDITYGFNAYWRRVMLNAETLSDGFEFEIQAAIRAARSGLSTAEVPCYEAPRAGGASKLSPVRDGWAIARILAVEAFPRSVTGFRAVADFYLQPASRSSAAVGTTAGRTDDRHGNR